jgi:4,5:9,10-diseco-3-hydroxy-5,9,17-trioxoandrosta-1(10),2-diene-4-oate hydrolase
MCGREIFRLSRKGGGFRAIAFDQPGFGLSDHPTDFSAAYRRKFIPKFIDALKIQKAHLIGHSSAGRIAVTLAFEEPQRISKIIVLGTGSLLPPLNEGQRPSGPAEGEEGTPSEPTLDEIRALLEQHLFHHSLITPEVLEKRHRMSVGKNFQAFLERAKAAEKGGGKESIPLWQRLDQVPVPFMLIYGKQDRGSAGERAQILKDRLPKLNLHVLDRCKHLVQWDAAAEFVRLSAQFLTA